MHETCRTLVKTQYNLCFQKTLMDAGRSLHGRQSEKALTVNIVCLPLRKVLYLRMWTGVAAAGWQWTYSYSSCQMRQSRMVWICHT